MDALIRSVELGPVRTRLSTEARGPAQGVRRDDAAAAQARLHDEIEKRMRAEMALQLQAQCDSERARARAEGYASGMSEGRAAAATLAAQTRTELEAQAQGALSTLEAAHRIALDKFEAGVGDVAFAALCRLVGRHAASELFTLGVVQQLCAPLRVDPVATARLHPRDIDTLRGLLANDELSLPSIGLKVIADESLELGGCVIQSTVGEYHGDLESQLRRLHAVLTGTAEQEG